MGTYVMEATEEGGYIPQGEDLSEVLVDYDTILEEDPLPSKDEVEAEIDRMLRLVRTFWKMEPDEVMRACSALGARCVELYVHLHRVEGRDRTWRQVRTQHVVPLQQELERQYTNASRMIEVRRQDLAFMQGQR